MQSPWVLPRECALVQLRNGLKYAFLISIQAYSDPGGLYTPFWEAVELEYDLRTGDEKSMWRESTKTGKEEKGNSTVSISMKAASQESVWFWMLRKENEIQKADTYVTHTFHKVWWTVPPGFFNSHKQFLFYNRGLRVWLLLTLQV